ncbi:hypothetical protein [Rubritalea tangerina]|uniref:hypothetical protein n=1 Tax=Rubritalea tangerina TaxID=430798 RepID=UPI003624014A
MEKNLTTQSTHSTSGNLSLRLLQSQFFAKTLQQLTHYPRDHEQLVRSSMLPSTYKRACFPPSNWFST